MVMRMRWRIPLIMLVAAGGLTACASSPQTTGAAPSSSGPAATSSSASPVTTNTARRNVAQQLVNKLLADVQLPPGAQAQPSAPASILTDPGATQVSANLVQAFGWFVVPGTEASVLAFETAHPLPGFSSSGSGPGFTEQDELFTGTQTADHGPPLIDVEATADGSNVAVRINVGVIWRPVRTAAEHVPDSVTGATAVLISSDPATSVQLDQATARQFAATLNDLDTQLPAERSCPPTPTTTLTFTTGGQKLVFEAGPCGSVVVTAGGVSQPTLAEYTTAGTSTLADTLNSLFGIVTSPAPPVEATSPASLSSVQASSPDAVPPVGSQVAATPAPGVTVTCPDIVHGDPGAIGFVGDIAAQRPPAKSTVFRAVVRCELVTRKYPGLGTWQVELAEVAYGNPTALITQLRAASKPPDGACGMGSQYGYPWFVLIETDGHVDRAAVPTQGCFASPSAVAAVNELPFKVVDAVRVWPQPAS